MTMLKYTYQCPRAFLENSADIYFCQGFCVTNIKLVCWQKQTKWIFITKIVQAHKHVQKFRIDINNLYDMLLSVVYDQNHYFGLGPIPKPKLK